MVAARVTERAIEQAFRHVHERRAIGVSEHCEFAQRTHGTVVDRSARTPQLQHQLRLRLQHARRAAMEMTREARLQAIRKLFKINVAVGACRSGPGQFIAQLRDTPRQRPHSRWLCPERLADPRVAAQRGKQFSLSGQRRFIGCELGRPDGDARRHKSGADLPLQRRAQTGRVRPRGYDHLHRVQIPCAQRVRSRERQHTASNGGPELAIGGDRAGANRRRYRRLIHSPIVGTSLGGRASKAAACKPLAAAS